MHPNPAFQGTDDARSLAFAAWRGFGMLTVNGPEGPLAAHVPFLLDTGAAPRIAAHLARSNAVLRAVGDGVAALLAVQGPDGYVSPDWYGMADQVPTWNYVAVHLRGTLRRLPDAALRPHIEALSAAFEARLPKRAWTHHKMDGEALARLERMIVPVEMEVEAVRSTWKLNQNKPDAARLGAAAAMAAGAPGSETGLLARLMADPGAAF